MQDDNATPQDRAGDLTDRRRKTAQEHEGNRAGVDDSASQPTREPTPDQDDK